MRIRTDTVPSRPTNGQEMARLTNDGTNEEAMEAEEQDGKTLGGWLVDGIKTFRVYRPPKITRGG